MGVESHSSSATWLELAFAEKPFKSTYYACYAKPERRKVLVGESGGGCGGGRAVPRRKRTVTLGGGGGML